MPIIKNKRTGREYPVSNQELKEIQSNPMTADAYLYPSQEVKVPVEVIKLEQQLRAQAKANAEGANSTAEVKTNHVVDNGLTGGSNDGTAASAQEGQKPKKQANKASKRGNRPKTS